MVNDEHLAILDQGADVWNKWRENHPLIKPDLGGANLIEADLGGANLSGADLTKADLRGANLIEADLSGADLHGAKLFETGPIEVDLSGADLSEVDLSETYTIEGGLRGADFGEAKLDGIDLGGADLAELKLDGADLIEADLSGADLHGADLHGADLGGADLRGANLIDANLSEANLSEAIMIKVNLHNADLSGCRVYGVSAWDLEGLEDANQNNLKITPEGSEMAEITVDNLEVAQFIYLMLHSEKVRNVLDIIASKAVLILGRFTPKRKAVLDALRDELRNRNYLPIMFDFEKQKSRNLTETISTLAHMSRFVIADITDAKSVPQELQAIIPQLPSVPIQPILQSKARKYSMFDDFYDHHQVLKLQYYTIKEDLLKGIDKKIIEPVEKKVTEIQKNNVLRPKQKKRKQTKTQQCKRDN